MTSSEIDFGNERSSKKQRSTESPALSLALGLVRIGASPWAAEISAEVSSAPDGGGEEHGAAVYRTARAARVTEKGIPHLSSTPLGSAVAAALADFTKPGGKDGSFCWIEKLLGHSAHD